MIPAPNQFDGTKKPVTFCPLILRIPYPRLFQLCPDIRLDLFNRKISQVMCVDANGLWIGEEFRIILSDIKDGIGPI